MPDNNFQFSRKSRTGAFFLLGLMILFAVAWRLIPTLQTPPEDPQEKELQVAWTQFKKENITEDRTARSYEPGQYDDERAEEKQVALHLQPFDPNTASEEVLTGLGLPLRTARTLIKYRSKGGRFRRREDLQKLYTLRKEDYERIAPYVRIPGAEGGNALPEREKYEEPAVPALIELNEADADALISLRGIGPGYSKRILSFRDALGGFFRVEQLQEVYGFPDSTYQQLKDRFSIDPAKVKLINVNTATEEELARHPYIGKRMAANIIKLRNDLKSFSEIVQIRQVPLINDEKYRKIAPYLSTH